MKKYNYHPYQAYHPSYNSYQQQHHHHNGHNHHQQNQQQLSPPPVPLSLLPPPPSPPTQQQPTHIANYQQQQRPQRPQQLTVASFAVNTPAATTITNSTATAATTATAVIATNLSSTQMSSLTSAQFLQNQYNLNYSNYNNNNNNNPQQHQQQQQQLHQQQHHNHLPFANNSNNSSSSNNNNNNLQQQQQYINLQQQLHLQQHAQTQLQLQQHQHQSHQQQRQHAAVEAASNTLANNTNNTNNNNNTGDKFTMDACEIANFLANELFMQQLVSMDGIQSGVPTLTTSTLTPTTLRSIEETFIQLTSDPINAPYQAGFIPPPLASFPSSSLTTPTAAAYTDFNDINDATDSEDSQGSSQNEAHLNEENSMATTDNSSAATDSTSYQNGLNGMGNTSLATSTSSTNDFTAANIAIEIAAEHARNNKHTSNSATTVTPAPTRRNQGGRRPAKSTNMSPEEEEKRRVRRERNKLAAARCRKRRVDQTNELQDEVAGLEKKREGLHNQIEMLTAEKESLEYLLESHRPTCQKIRQDLMSVSTFGGLIAPTTAATTTTISITNHHHHHNNNNSNDSNSTITGLDTTLASTAGRSVSPIDLKPNMLDIVQHIKNEPLDTAFDSNSSLDHDDGPPSPKRIMFSKNNTMIPPPLPNVATLSASLAAASASLNTPVMTTAPVSFGSFISNHATLNSLNALNKLPQPNGSKQRPNTLPTFPRSLGQLNVDGKAPTDINGVAIQTPSTGMFNFDSLMDGGTGLTPVSGPLVPTCSSQTNKHPLELQTPTSEPSKLVSL